MLTEPELDNGTSPLLADGTPVSALVDRERRQTSLRLFSDAEVFELEQEHLFAKIWNLLAHESEIPEPGDFVTRSIGLDGVIVARGNDGGIHVSLNVCTHRGMSVCRADSGNASTFKCPYHGWAFGRNGSFVGAPLEKDFYTDGLDKPSLGLQQARVELYAGFIFANWSAAAPSLTEFLGPYKYYLDTIFNSTDDGLEVVGAPQRFVVRANWKTAAEQFNGADGYHVATLHRSMFESQMNAMGIPPNPELISTAVTTVLGGIDISSKEGHGLRTRQIGDWDAVKNLTRHELIATLQSGPTSGGMAALPSELVAQFSNHLSDGQLRMMAAYPPSVGGIFPNVGFLGLNIRVFAPRDPNHFEMINWAIVPKAVSPQMKAAQRKMQLSMFGTSGTIEQDDAESWPSIQKSSKGFMGRRHSMKYQALIGDNKPDGWEGGANVHPGLSKDDSGWHFWLRYRDYMTGQPW